MSASKTPYHFAMLLACSLSAIVMTIHAEVLVGNIGEYTPTDIIRSNAPTAKAIPFTTYPKEQQLILNTLPCKWVSQNGKVRTESGAIRYDFLCKGGNWGTISLYLDKTDSIADGLASVRLHYRAWKAEAHPSAGESAEAQKFLQHIAMRFIPANLTDWSLDAFWSESPRRWEGQGVVVTYEHDARPTFALHKLEIIGTGRMLTNVLSATPPTKNLPQAQKPTPPTEQNTTNLNYDLFKLSTTKKTSSQSTSSLQAATTTGLLNPTVGIKRAVTPTTPSLPNPTIQWQASTAPMPVLPIPQPPTTNLLQPLPAIARPVSGLLIPAQVPSGTVNMLKAWINPKPTPSPTLVSATAAELNTRPAPESRNPTTPPPAIDTKLVPNTTNAISSRPKAPSNFDAYNRAEQLTRSTEERARITGSTPQSAAPNLPAVPTPSAQTTTAPNAVTIQPQQNLRKPTPRPLPQLQFIPAAEPLTPNNSHSPIVFEDEKSGL